MINYMSKIIKNIKNIQTEKYSKNISLPLIGKTYENQIVKVIPNNKIAYVQQINAKSTWEILFKSKLKILDYVTDKNGEFYFTGYFDDNIYINSIYQTFHGKISEKNYTDVFVARMKNSEIVYIKFIPGLKNDKAHSIQIDNHNDIYISGYFTDSITFDANYLNADGDQKNLFVAKLDGRTWEWIWAFNAGKEDFESSAKFIKIFDNHIYLCGYFDREIEFETIPPTFIKTNGKNLLILKLNAINGDLIWIKYTECNHTIKPKDMIIKNKKIYITGYQIGNINFSDSTPLLCNNDLNHKTLFISCLDIKKEGKWLWHRTFNSKNCIGKKIKIDRDNNIYILAYYENFLEIDDNTFTEKNNIILKFNNYYKLEWNLEINAIIDDFELDIQYFLYLIGKTNDENNILINHQKYFCEPNQIFIVKINGIGSFDSIHFTQFNTSNKNNKNTKLKIYNFNGFNIGGIDSNNMFTLFRFSYDDRNLKCLGIVKTPGTSINNEMIDIDFSGYISTGYKELEPGYNYYIQEDGSINILPNDFYFGTALTTDKMLIK